MHVDSANRGAERRALLNILGTMYRANGDHDRAATCLQDVLNTDPEYYFASSNLAKVRALQHDWSAAADIVSRGCVVAEEAEQDGSYKDGIYRTAAVIQLANGSTGLARDSIGSALALDRKDHRSHLVAAYIELVDPDGDPTRMLRAAHRALDFDADRHPNPLVARLLAIAYLLDVQPDDDIWLEQAEDYVIQVGDRDDDAPYVSLLRTLLRARQGRIDRARDELVELERPSFENGLLARHLPSEELWVDHAVVYDRLVQEIRNSLDGVESE